MKFLVLLAILGVLYLVWRTQRTIERRGERPPPRKAAQGTGGAQEMVRCAVCSVHLPRGDALPDPRTGSTWYCCAEHRQQGADAKGRG